MIDLEAWLGRRIDGWLAAQPGPGGLDRPTSRALVTVRVMLVGYWVALALGTHWPSLTLVEGDTGVLQVNKALHVSAFAGLTLLLTLAMPAGRRRGGPRGWVVQATVAAAIAGVYSIIDEVTQVFVDRRASMADIVANLIGVTGMYLVLASLWSRAAIRRGSSGAAAVTGARWMVVTARGLLLVGGPLLFLLAVLPAGHDFLVWVGRRVLGPQPQPGPGWWLHFFTAMGCTWLLACGLVAGRRRPALSALVTIAGMGLAGPMIEMIQARTGRSYNVEDVYANSWGILIAIMVWAVVLAWWTLVREHDAARDRLDPGDESTN
ncbi:VanZ family protein [Phycisphaerales bacterium AB-hyl4]|uniref:VanZ family protein n=1 Tax=Natronomicrosphaera hydrolytica TaxID=3242702 RepID=A0ABV4U5D1_9BACT